MAEIRITVFRDHGRDLTPDEREARHLKLMELCRDYGEDDETIRRLFDQWCEEHGL